MHSQSKKNKGKAVSIISVIMITEVPLNQNKKKKMNTKNSYFKQS